MWVMTRYGFFSAVCARKGTGLKSEPVDTDRVMIRARLRGHLENLKEGFPNHLGTCEIRQTAGSDYKYRIVIDKTVWVEVLSELATETDYDNFKSAVSKHLGRQGEGYVHALHDVWSVMFRLQK